MSKVKSNHETLKILFLLNKTFYYIHNLFKQYILDVFWFILQLYLEHRVGFLNTVFDLFDFFYFCYPFLVMISKIHSFICKVKNDIQNPLFFLK
jgi:hypothetical protein